MTKDTLTWKIEKRKVETLTPADYNPRVLSEKAKADLMKSIERFGEVEPLIVNQNGNVIGGHSRIKVFADLGIAECDVMTPSRKLTTSEEKELNIRLNKNTGDVWQLGNHRLICGDSADSTVFEKLFAAQCPHCDKSKDYIHPTQKPVRLPERAIKKSCPMGGIVVEPFCGSGSTLMACEQLERSCYACELDPRYCDAIIRRWQKYTGKTAECLTRAGTKVPTETP